MTVSITQRGWLYAGELFPLSDEDIFEQGWYAFTYVITFVLTGQKYIGKKVFISKRRLKPLKGKKRTRIVYKPSDWRKYYSSSKVIAELIKEHGTGGFRREIIALHKHKRGANIHELQLQIIHNVLDAQDSNGVRLYLNDNIDRLYYPTKDAEEREARNQLFEKTINEDLP